MENFRAIADLYKSPNFHMRSIKMKQTNSRIVHR